MEQSALSDAIYEEMACPLQQKQGLSGKKLWIKLVKFWWTPFAIKLLLMKNHTKVIGSLLRNILDMLRHYNEGHGRPHLSSSYI